MTKLRFSSSLFRRYNELPLILVYLVIFAALSILSPVFLSVTNLSNIGVAVAVLGILVVAESVVIFSGGLDLSLGAAVGISSSILGLCLVNASLSPWLAILASSLSGLAVGLLNGFIINVIGINSIITTLGTLSILRGLALVATGGQSIVLSDPIVAFWGRGRVLSILPVPGLIMIVLFLLFHFILKYTVWGRYVYTVGGNVRAARLTGISIKKLRFQVFAIAGLLAGIAGFITTGLTGLALPQAANGYELDATAAVLLGGASLFGGKGNLFGSLIGLLIIGTVNNGMVLMDIPSFWQTVAKGVLLIVAVTVDHLRKRRTEGGAEE
jgi:ribose/xylose/arabinose/galactoside ABC-type transport system permease subunit